MSSNLENKANDSAEKVIKWEITNYKQKDY